MKRYRDPKTGRIVVELEEGDLPDRAYTHNLPVGERQEQGGKRPAIEISEVAVAVLGPHGRLISGSKSAYWHRYPDNEVWFNACIFSPEGDEIWFGDVDLTLEEDRLHELAGQIGAFYLTRERPYRFEGLPDDPSADEDGIRRFEVS